MGITADEQFMQQALACAHKAQAEGEVPVGAVIVFDSKVIAEGWNKPIGGNDPTAHAEIVAMRNAANALQNYRLNGATLYVTLEPCAMCVGAMIHARIKRLVFGAFDRKAGAVQSQLTLPSASHFNHRLDIQSGVLSGESSCLLKMFFKARRK